MEIARGESKIQADQYQEQICAPPHVVAVQSMVFGWGIGVVGFADASWTVPRAFVVVMCVEGRKVFMRQGQRRDRLDKLGVSRLFLLQGSDTAVV